MVEIKNYEKYKIDDNHMNRTILVWYKNKYIIKNSKLLGRIYGNT